jgi:hypothetical protein
MAGMAESTNNLLPRIVYAILLALAFTAALIAFGNEAGWWRIDF